MITLRIALREFSDFEVAFAAQIAAFRKLRPDIDIHAVPLNLEKLHQELLTEAGLTSGRWDMGMMVTDWLADAVAAGAIENLSPYMAAAPLPDWPSGWAASILEPLNFDGSYYCIPWHDGPECLIYRSDLFRSAKEQVAFRSTYGYDLEPPRTWKQFEDVARFFTRPEQGLYGTAFACYPDGHNTLYDFALQVWSRGGEFYDRSGYPDLVTSQAAAALDYYRRIVQDATVCHPASIDLDSVQCGNTFLAGSVAMMVNWFGFAARAGRVGSSLNERVSLAPIPCSEGLSPISLSVFWTIAIASGTEHKQAAYDFLRFLAQAAQDREVVRHGVVGVRLSTWRDLEVQSTIPAFCKIEEISRGARRLPRTPSLPEFADIVNKIIERSLRTSEPSESILRWAQAIALEKHIRFQRESAQTLDT
ncbi:ABC transporter substrate-binding protein [Acidipila rosea]|uniref:Carbohydrate ABC transporter substrate-binding protein (CUT1 family) n=1 Tax=Acidipila rosea TaxID=768535 RepID=A0A4R1L045_9BACT|nr:sugar ABC transporter substrate-binding protein [Acidipila rosea]TCK70183.1 carbohydrate ABC transporter substrate-binding protein (CUT1 family) [Acidipila rosea]